MYCQMYNTITRALLKNFFPIVFFYIKWSEVCSFLKYKEQENKKCTLNGYPFLRWHHTHTHRGVIQVATPHFTILATELKIII